MYLNFIEIKKFKIAIHPLFLVLAVTMIALGYIEQFFILFLITTIHEAAHIITAKIYGINLVKIIIYPIGEMAVLDNIYLLKPFKKIVVICAGPFINILLGFIFMNLTGSNIVSFIVIANFSIGIFNSLPVYPLDGGRILHLFLSNKIGILNANDIIINISRTFISIMGVLGIIQVILYPYNISLICIAIYLRKVIKNEVFNLSLEFFNNISSKIGFINKYGSMNTFIITVSEDILIKDILRYLKSDSICKICIVDKQFNLIGNITENELIGFIVKYGLRVDIKKTVKI